MEIKIVQKPNEMSHQGKMIFDSNNFVEFTINSGNLEKLVNNNKSVKTMNKSKESIHTLVLKISDDEK